MLQLPSEISRTRILDLIKYPSFLQSHMSIYNHPKNKVSVTFIWLSDEIFTFFVELSANEVINRVPGGCRYHGGGYAVG